MGKAGSKITNITNSNANIKDFNPEFDYRTKNLKKLKDAYKMLKDSLAKSMANMEGTPQRLKEVGGGYSAVAACLNYGGGGGSASRRGSAADPNTVSVNDVSASNGNFAAGGSPPARLDRELADESFQASKKFCEAMETLSTGVYPKYRGTLQAKVMHEVDSMLERNASTSAQGKKTADAMSKYVAARKAVTASEKAGTKKGTDLSLDKVYTKQVADRDTKEKIYQTELQNFDDQYETLMAEAQKFAAESTEVFLDCVVGYFREMVETIDYTETPTRSKTRNRSLGNCGDLQRDESREPTYAASLHAPEAPVKSV